MTDSENSPWTQRSNSIEDDTEFRVSPLVPAHLHPYFHRAREYAIQGDRASEESALGQAMQLLGREGGIHAVSEIVPEILRLRKARLLHSLKGPAKKLPVIGEAITATTTTPGGKLTAQQARELIRIESERAERYASQGDVSSEFQSLDRMRAIAKRSDKATRREIESQIINMRSAGTIFIRASLIGSVRPENAFSKVGRTGSLLAGLDSDGQTRIDIYSDRVIRGSQCERLDRNTSAAVDVQGRDQVKLVRPKDIGEARDRRTAEFRISGLHWSMRVAIDPDQLTGPRDMADRANKLAENAPVTPAPKEARKNASTAARDMADRANKLAENAPVTSAPEEARKNTSTTALPQASDKPSKSTSSQAPTSQDAPQSTTPQDTTPPSTTQRPDHRSNKLRHPGFWIALAGLILSATVPWVGALLALAGLGLSVTATVQIPSGALGRKLAIAGIVLGGIGIIVVVSTLAGT